MALVDAQLGGPWSSSQSLTGTSDQVSTNVYDVGSAKKLFGGTSNVKIPVYFTATGGTTPTVRARFVGADDAALTTNPEILDDTGASKAIVAADLPVMFELKPSNQKVAKRYYGLIYTQGGTSPTATVSAAATVNSQSNLIR